MAKSRGWLAGFIINPALDWCQNLSSVRLTEFRLLEHDRTHVGYIVHNLRFVFRPSLNIVSNDMCNEGNECEPIQLAQCRFPGMAISSAKILILYVFYILYTEAILLNSTRKLLWFEITKMLIAYTHTRLTALFPGLPRWAGTRKQGSFPVRKRTGTLKIWRAREREPIWGSGGGAPSGSRGRAPGQGVRGAKPPWSWRHFTTEESKFVTLI